MPADAVGVHGVIRIHLDGIARLITKTATWRPPPRSVIAGLQVRRVGTVWIPPPGGQVQQRPPSHMHFLSFLVHGLAEFSYAGRISVLHAGEALVMPAGGAYVYHSTDQRGWRSCWFGFEAPGLALPAGPTPAPPAAQRMVMRLLRLAGTSDAPGPRVALALAELLVELELAPRIDPANDDPICHAITRLQADPTRTWNLATLARTYGLSATALRLGVRQRTGQTPTQLLRGERMRLVTEALDAGASVAEASRAGGFTDPFYCSRLFRRVHGCPPSAWVAARGG